MAVIDWSSQLGQALIEIFGGPWCERSLAGVHALTLGAPIAAEVSHLARKFDERDQGLFLPVALRAPRTFFFPLSHRRVDQTFASRHFRLAIESLAQAPVLH